MSLFIFLTVIQAIVAAALVTVVLMQRSEGGGLGIGGSPGGLMSARGAADFLTRATSILATLFVILSIALAALAVENTGARTVDTSLDRSVPTGPAVPVQPGPTEAPADDDPLAGAAQE
ncbi:MAG: preprotein translocase subunit SecG [Sphingomonadales bacterium CG12_big_fil_rev_8_21_14_0_65_65_10]|nr:MAG: preprotein translocase subunit SecG [Sphingomonadales bacterium CG12_big_fil_rev_8_21_14_0_65_65_10]